jgi:multisubunit Na+/H+ antiporter MnhG subunit
MAAGQLAVWVLLGLAAATVTIAGIGLVAARDTIPRLHFVTPVTSLAAPLTAVAYAVDQGWGLSAGLVLAVAGLVAVTGPPLGAAVARTAARQEDLIGERDR